MHSFDSFFCAFGIGSFFSFSIAFVRMLDSFSLMRFLFILHDSYCSVGFVAIQFFFLAVLEVVIFVSTYRAPLDITFWALFCAVCFVFVALETQLLVDIRLPFKLVGRPSCIKAQEAALQGFVCARV